MSINFCDLKYGTTITVGRDIYYSYGINADPTMSPGRIDHLEPNSTKDIEFRFKVPIDLRALTFNYNVVYDQFRLRSNQLVGMKILTWGAMSMEIGEGPAVPYTHFPNRILRCPALPSQIITVLNTGYKTSDKMRQLGFNMDPCYPPSGAKKYGILPEHQIACLNITRIRIKLTHLSETSRVAFRRFIILGQPSDHAFSNPTFSSSAERLLNHRPEIPKTPVKSRTSRGLRMVQECRISESTDIPPEFLDPFTQQLMECPMELPSGRVCDKLYLAKYNRVEKKWTRKPSDPFTGQLLIRGHSPVLNVELKKRIDKWTLLKMFGTIPEWYQEETTS